MDTTALNKLANTDPNARTAALYLAHAIETWDDPTTRRQTIAWMQTGYGLALIGNWVDRSEIMREARDWLQEQTLLVEVSA